MSEHHNKQAAEQQRRFPGFSAPPVPLPVSVFPSLPSAVYGMPESRARADAIRDEAAPINATEAFRHRSSAPAEAEPLPMPAFPRAGFCLVRALPSPRTNTLLQCPLFPYGLPRRRRPEERRRTCALPAYAAPLPFCTSDAERKRVYTHLHQSRTTQPEPGAGARPGASGRLDLKALFQPSRFRVPTRGRLAAAGDPSPFASRLTGEALCYSGASCIPSAACSGRSPAHAPSTKGAKGSTLCAPARLRLPFRGAET